MSTEEPLAAAPQSPHQPQLLRAQSATPPVPFHGMYAVASQGLTRRDSYRIGYLLAATISSPVSAVV